MINYEISLRFLYSKPQSKLILGRLPLFEFSVVNHPPCYALFIQPCEIFGTSVLLNSLQLTNLSKLQQQNLCSQYCILTFLNGLKPSFNDSEES
ncbi:uncharacterized protein Bfra_001806 [Botrytis fragariae]|uniref:Uncharacterized protein n=1 Tax=Botrytis fragariae TaxID=1964551 RepID=A0A8H6EMC8_9HELO|nr:uncharacterized protein Bfra_001806 [Botrytis fragariae]KAF5877439.1 hypothetical protein Bfra_001806 [Botrytis fragariae]